MASAPRGVVQGDAAVGRRDERESFGIEERLAIGVGGVGESESLDGTFPAESTLVVVAETLEEGRTVVSGVIPLFTDGLADVPVSCESGAGNVEFFEGFQKRFGGKLLHFDSAELHG